MDNKYTPITSKAWMIINGERRQDYGEVNKSFYKTSQMWSLILEHSISSEQVAQCMIALKLCREINNHKEDNLVDICGYAELLNMMKNRIESKEEDTINEPWLTTKDILPAEPF